MGRYQKKIRRILENDYGVRSGVYSAIDPNIAMELDANGEYRMVFSGMESESVYRKLLDVDMMSDESPNEDILGRQLFGSGAGMHHDDVLGYYQDLYIGYVKKAGYRKRGSSGGVTSWILAELLRKKKIDGVIHVNSISPQDNDGRLFKYEVSRTLKDIHDGAKSRYYPMELSEVLATVKSRPGKYAVVGIPEFITELRLLGRVDPIINERIVYMLGLVCGHQKTARYAEALAWQHGILPGNLQQVDFRIKQPHATATDYLQEFTGYRNGKKVTLRKTHDELFGGDWALGFFKSKFSDFTDNTFNELADVTLGDAWLDEYNSDGMGNNIIIVRNPDIAELLKGGLVDGSIKLDEASPDTIKQSQRGLIHHTRDELPYRLYREKKQGRWVPKKRTKPSGSLKPIRREVQDIRYKMARGSHVAYATALAANSWDTFQSDMGSMVDQYYRLYDRIRSGDTDKGQSRLSGRRALRRIKRSIDQIRIKVRVRTRIKNIRRRRLAASEMRRQRNIERLQKREYFNQHKEFLASDGAILTLPGYFNYGNLVQRFALQHFLKLNNKHFVSYVRDIPVETKDDAIRFKYTEDFVKRTIWRKPVDLRDEFKSYIVGSDQVWRNWGYYDVYDSLGFFFLDFTRSIRTKRIAYAASFGQDTLEDALISDEFAQYITPVMLSFSNLSVRETSGVELVKNVWGVAPAHVIDPTMLLTAGDYDKLIDAAPYKLKEIKPVFTYFIRMNSSKRDMMEKLCRDMGVEHDGINLENEHEQLPPVEYWIKGIRDADVLVTDSFHGVVFALLYNTPFILLESGTGGVGRTETLLGKLGLTERYVTSDRIDTFSIDSLAPIDWVAVNAIIATQRKQSAKWLLRAVRSKRGVRKVATRRVRG